MFTALRKNDDGIGLIEIVVSMFLLALVAMAFLPFLIRSFTLTRANTTLASATQLLDSQFAELRANDATCAALTTFKNARTATSAFVITDTDRNMKLRVVVTSFTCPTGSGTTDLAMSIVDGTGATIVSAVTKVYVAS